MSMAERFFTMSQHVVDFKWRDPQELAGVNLKRKNPPALGCPGRVFKSRVIAMTSAIIDSQCLICSPLVPQ